LVAAAAYMARIERLYAVDSAVVADDGNGGGGGRGGEAGAPRGDGIARVNGQAAATVAAVEEEEEGAADRNGNRVADGDGGPITHSDREDGDGSAAPRSGRMTTTTPATAVGGGAAAIVRRDFSAAVVVVVVVVVVACGAVCGWEIAITTTTATTATAMATILNAGPPGAPPRCRRRRNHPYEISSGRRSAGCRSSLALAPRRRQRELLSSSRSRISHCSRATRSKARRAGLRRRPPSDGAPARMRSIADLRPPSPNTWKVDARLWCGTSPCSL
jgi:hypothetical protein